MHAANVELSQVLLNDDMTHYVIDNTEFKGDAVLQSRDYKITKWYIIRFIIL